MQSFLKFSRATAPLKTRVQNVHIEKRIKDLGHQLPAQPADPKGNYMQYSVLQLAGTRQLVYLSGHLPQKVDGTLIKGRIGENLTLEQGAEASRIAALQILASLQR